MSICSPLYGYLAPRLSESRGPDGLVFARDEGATHIDLGTAMTIPPKAANQRRIGGVKAYDASGSESSSARTLA